MSLAPKGKGPSPPPLRLAHVLRPGSSGPVLVQRCSPGGHFLATLHRQLVVLHPMPPSSTPSLKVRPSSEARCMDVGPSPRTGDGDQAAVLLVAMGGTFGLELHRVPQDEAHPPRRVKRNVPVAVVRFSGDGAYVAVACLNGHIGESVVRLVTYGGSRLTAVGLLAGVWPVEKLGGHSSPQAASAEMGHEHYLPWTNAVVR